MGLPAPKTASKIKKDMSLSNILKSEVLNWYLFKSGLREPRLNSLPHEQALNEGLVTINDLQACKQELAFELLKIAPKEPQKALTQVNSISLVRDRPEVASKK